MGARTVEVKASHYSLNISCGGKTERIGEPKPAPVPPLDIDWRRNIHHGGESASSHVAAISLQEKSFFIFGGRKSDPVFEKAPVSAMCGVPNRILSLRLRELAVMRRKKAVFVNGCTENDAGVEVQRSVEKRLQQAVEHCAVTRFELRRIRALDGTIILVEELGGPASMALESIVPALDASRIDSCAKCECGVAMSVVRSLPTEPRSHSAGGRSTPRSVQNASLPKESRPKGKPPHRSYERPWLGRILPIHRSSTCRPQIGLRTARWC